MRRSFLFGIISVVLGCALGLLIGELALRIWTPDWLTARMKELNVAQTQALGFDYKWPYVKENGEFRNFVPHSEFDAGHYEWWHKVHIDAWSGRVTAYAEEAKDGPFVAFMGDSFCFGLGVEDEDAFVSRLGAKSKYRFLNLGVPGNNLRHQLNLIELRHAEVNSPLVYVFVFYLGNDILGYPPEEKNEENVKALREKERRRGVRRYLMSINRFVYHNAFLKKSFLIQFIRRALLTAYNRSTGDEFIFSVFAAMDTKKIDAINAEVENGLERELDRLPGLSGELDFEYLFILIPSAYQVYPDRLAWRVRYYGLDAEAIDPDQPNRIVRKQLEERGIPYFDVLEFLRHKEGQLYFVQDQHLTLAGEKAVAEYLSPRLEKKIDELLAGKTEPAVNAQ